MLLGLPAAPSSAAGPDPAVREALEGAIAAGEVAGAVAVVAGRDGVVSLTTAGNSDVASGKPMEPDALFWIASMSKPVAAVAVMMMQEEGKLSVSDPVAEHLPEFAALRDAEGQPVEVTVQQLLTHTSGLAELSAEETKSITTLAGLTPLVAAKPVRFPPGSRWAYCQSSINTAGRLVEVASGMSLPEFLRERLFAPLGMDDTSFYPTPEQAGRLATSYRRTDSGTLEPSPIGFLQGAAPSDRERCPLPNGGLFSTAPDYARFCQMVLRGGELDGHRYLEPESVASMTGPLTGDLATGFTPGNAWGLGWCVVREPQGVTEALHAGSFGHGGAYGTQAWIDPSAGRAYILMVQRANFLNSDNSDLRRAFQGAAAR
jgi:CubicO group peptidase (beta-lactamase class C family)